MPIFQQIRIISIVDRDSQRFDEVQLNVYLTDIEKWLLKEIEVQIHCI